MAAAAGGAGTVAAATQPGAREGRGTASHRGFGALRIAAHLQISCFYCGEELRKQKGRRRTGWSVRRQPFPAVHDSAALPRTPPTPDLASGTCREPGAAGEPPPPDPAPGSSGSRQLTLPPSLVLPHLGSRRTGDSCQLLEHQFLRSWSGDGSSWRGCWKNWR